jgi:hypothetical protein
MWSLRKKNEVDKGGKRMDFFRDGEERRKRKKARFLGCNINTK